MKNTVRNIAGFTLIEMVVTLGIFGVVSTMMYGTFNLVGKQVGNISTKNSLSEKGQRILAYMEEDVRMIAYLLGPDASIPYCAGEADGLAGSGTLPATSPVLTYTSGTPYDNLMFITSTPVKIKESSTTCMTGQEDCASGSNVGTNNPRVDYFLTTQCDAAAGVKDIYVDAGTSCFDDIEYGGSAAKNGRALVTFDSLLLSASAVAGSAPQVYYSLSTTPGSTTTLSEALQQNIPDNSTVYGVRMYRYVVDTAGGKRNLKRVGWDKACATGADVTVNLIETTNSANTAGGVDGLKFEFVSIDSISGALVTGSSIPANLNELKAIRIWLLLRADKPDPDFTDTATYTLGTTANKITLGPYTGANSHYRRLLLNKTVEVKNLARIY